MRIKLELIVATVYFHEDARWSHSKNTFRSKGYRAFTIALLSFHSMWMLHLSNKRRWDKTLQMKTFPSKSHEKLFQHVVSNGQGKVCKIVYQHHKSNVLHVHMPQKWILLAHIVSANDFYWRTFGLVFGVFPHIQSLKILVIKTSYHIIMTNIVVRLFQAIPTICTATSETVSF